MTFLLETALEWQTAGASIVPVRGDGSKAPAAFWKPYQTTAPTRGQLEVWFSNGQYDGLGVICGAVSGHLEMLEVEARAVDLAADIGQALADHGLGDLWHRIDNGCVEATPTGGIHWHYRVTDGAAAPNTKLASRPNDTGGVDVMIETRGEGGFTILAPSNGRTHPTGRPWTRMGGGPDSIPTITAAERDALHSILRIFDQTPFEPIREPRHLTSVGSGLRPGDDYNARAVWADLLEPAGWQRVGKAAGGGSAWVRPGKNPRDGISATTRQTDTGDWLYVFTTSTNFQADRAYTKFSAYTLLHHAGDYTEAAKQLRRDGYGDDRPFPGTTPLPTATNGSTQPSAATVATLTQAGVEIHSGQVRIALRLAAHYRDQLLHVHGVGWHHYDGRRWVEDDTRQAGQAVLRIIRDAILESVSTGDKKLRADATRCESDTGVKGTLGVAACLPEFAATVRDLDQDSNLLNVANGTLDLLDLTLRPHSPTDRLTKVCNAAYHPDATSALWDAFLARVLPDEDVRAYLQRYVGAGLSGRVLEHALAILTGEGRNGKGVFYGTVRAVLGDYAATADPDLFMHREGAHPTGEMDLRGIRWVVVSESDKNRKLAEATVKRLTGGDEIKARRMRQDFVAFQPSHTAALVTNHLPKVSGDDPALWSRLRVIPFNIVIPEEERDLNLGIKLTAEIDAVLGWLLVGWREHQARGRLDEPAAVLRATDKYRIDSDAISGFLESRCIVNPHMRVAVGDLWSSWVGWCSESGADATNQKAFGEALDRRGFAARKGSGGIRLRSGLGLLSDDEDGE